MQKVLAQNTLWHYALAMTDHEFEIIKRVSRIHGFIINEPSEGGDFRFITDSERQSDFYWVESEGFDEFFQQLSVYFYDRGYDKAIR